MTTQQQQQPTLNQAGEEWVEKDCPIEENNDDCSKCGIILTDDDMYSETGKCEMCNEEEGVCPKCDDIGNPTGMINGLCPDCYDKQEVVGQVEGETILI